ncbi:MAG: ABC transporter permease [Actinobacteria bacterium]|nr:MAG: ABC transporter permease [Actinomycetota bacterium]
MPLRLGDLWAYRELLATLALRDLKVRYKQTELGAAWAIIQPFLLMVVFTLIFGGGFGQKAADGSPYPIFSYAALLPLTYFTNAIAQSGNSMIESANLITKVYFPRLVIPLAAVIAGLVDFGIAFAVLVAMMLFYGIVPGPAILLLPLLLLLAMLAALGIGLWLAALNVEYRDVRYVIPFVVQFWLFFSPVIYPLSRVPSKWRLVYSLNPMVGVIQGFRWALLGKVPFPAVELAISLAVVIALLTGGLFYFRRMERTFADVV